MSGDVHDFNDIEIRVVKFSFLQGKALKEIHAILTETLGERAPSYATVKNWLAHCKRVIFSPVMRILEYPKLCQPLKLLIKFRSYSWKTAGFRLNQ
jgi:hypothetical protein